MLLFQLFENVVFLDHDLRLIKAFVLLLAGLPGLLQGKVLSAHFSTLGSKVDVRLESSNIRFVLLQLLVLPDIVFVQLLWSLDLREVHVLHV